MVHIWCRNRLSRAIKIANTPSFYCSNSDTTRPMNEAMRQDALAKLHFVLKHEPEALQNLIEYRQPVSPQFLRQQTDIVIQVDDVKTGARPMLGVLGLINGLLGPDFRIVAVFEDDGSLIEFKPFKPVTQP